MCGIAGFAGFDDDRLLKAMCAVLTHRGPDEEGYFMNPGVGLAMRRLAVIDLLTGRQPIANETGDVHVVLNGEIYNYQELTRRLQEREHHFATRSDTETLVHLYEDHDLDFVRELRGMFAIALWDARRKRLVLVRDRIGEKPLYYAQRGNRLLFGSEIKAILQAGGSRSVDRQAVCDFLAMGYVPSPRTFFDGIRKLGAGEMLVWEDGRSEIRRYAVRCPRSQGGITFDVAAGRLAELLSDTTHLCLKSDVEVGAFLSGGIDSSVLVALMRRHAAQVQTFSVGYRGSAAGFNELAYARRVARELGTKHHELILDAYSTVDLLPRILWHYDEPHGEPTSILVYLLCQFTRQRVKVAVGGTGGDEIFFGYPRHGAIRMLEYYRWLPHWAREYVVRRIVERWPESTRGSRFAKRAKRFVQGGGLPPERAYLSWISLLEPSTRSSLLDGADSAGAGDPSGEAFLRAYLCDDPRSSLLERAANVDLNGYLPEYQLAYMDRMSMAHGLEVRSPLCDYRVVDFVTGLPTEYRLRGTRSKHILKHVAKQWIPEEIAERKKVGFDSPIGQWAKQHLREFIFGFLSPKHIARSGLLNPDAVQRLLSDHASSRRDYSLQLWSLLALEAWHRMYIEDGVTDGRDYRVTDLRGAVPNGGNAKTGYRGSTSRLSDGSVRMSGPRHSGASAVTGLRRQLWERSPRPVRRFLTPIVAHVPPQTLLGPRFRDWLAFLHQAQWWTPEQSVQYQIDRVRRVCQLAHRWAPFYRELFDAAGFCPDDLHSLEQLQGLPTIDRRAVDQHWARMCTRSTRSPGVDRITTGGTNGRPLSFYIGADRSNIEYAHLIASWERSGFRLGMPLAVFRGRVIPANGRGARHDYDPILRHHHYSNFHMADEDIRGYLQHVAGIGPGFLHVYPSSAAALARYLRRTGVRPPENVRGIIAESENVYPEQRALVESVLGCRYFSCYGHSEKLVLAAECEHSTDYHVWPTYGYFELLDEAGCPVTTPGQRGEIVGTGFINTVMPFIRYRTGDYATFVADHCDACGRQHPLIRDVRGHNTQEVLVLADRSQVSWAALNMHDDTFDGVRQFQFLQEAPGHALLRVVPAQELTADDLARIRQRLNRKLEERLQFDIQLVEHIPLTDRGKSIFVDQRIPDSCPAQD